MPRPDGSHSAGTRPPRPQQLSCLGFIGAILEPVPRAGGWAVFLWVAEGLVAGGSRRPAHNGSEGDAAHELPWIESTYP